MVDAHSKWLIVEPVPSTTSQCTIQKLRSIFAIYGLPEVIVSDNGTSFTSSEFQNGIRHSTTAPYHPSSNGLAERAVRIFKEAMRKATNNDKETKLARFLFHYQTTPHSTTGVSPAELIMGHQLRTLLDLMKPDIAKRVEGNQIRQKALHDQHAKQRTVAVDDPVIVRNFAKGPRWIPGIIAATKGKLVFLVKLTDGRIVRRHIDHIRYRTGDTAAAEEFEEQEDDPLPNPITQAATSSNDPAIPAPPRCSHRSRRPPERLM